MSYNPNIPQATDDLSVSQGQLLGNFQQLDTIFGIEHYPYSNLTSNVGFHNQVTTPNYVANPPTGNPPVTTTAPIFYGFTIGNADLQFSRGINNAVPSPLTRVNSPATPVPLGPSNTGDIFDFTGLTNAAFSMVAYDSTTLSSLRQGWGFWNGTAFSPFIMSANALSPPLVFQSTGNILQVLNQSVGSLNNVYWSLEFWRLA